MVGQTHHNISPNWRGSAEAGDSAASPEPGDTCREGEQVAQDWKAAFRW